MVLLIVLTSVLGACSADDTSDDRPAAKSATATEVVVPLDARVGTVTGEVTPRSRRQAVASIGKVVDGWFEAAWLDDDRPQRTGLESWPGFTRELAVRARRDKAVTSNARLIERINASDVVRRSVKVDLLGTSGRAVGATARFRLVLDTSGAVARRVVVTGRLELSPATGGWRVFGYDVARSARAVPTGGEGS